MSNGSNVKAKKEKEIEKALTSDEREEQIRLARDGTILEANLTIARMLSIERSRLLGVRFGSFLDQRDLSVFNSLVDRVFQIRTQEHCEIMVGNSDTTNHPTKLQRTLQLDAIISDNPHECLLSLTDRMNGRKIEYIEPHPGNHRQLPTAILKGAMLARL